MTPALLLANKLAVVTGGGRGIGRAITLELARHGADVLVGYVRREAAAERTAEEARELGVQAHLLRAHVGDEDQVKRLFAEIAQRFGYLDILVNNAASGVNRAALGLEARHWDWTMNVNARAAWLASKYAAPLMRGRKGTVVNLSSLGATRVVRDYFAVGVSKAALEAVTRYLAVELAPLEISVNAVSGGLVKTDALEAFSWGEELARKVRGRVPAGRMLESSDLAGVVVFLCSDQARMIRGQTILVDGGVSLLA